MAFDYGFGKLENELIEAGKEYPPNYEKMLELLAAGANINATSTEEDPDESILSTIILGYPEIEAPEACEHCEKEGKNPCGECLDSFEGTHDGRYLPDICDFFLKNGFDVHGSNNAFGSRCIMNLTWSSYDRYILDATKILLRAGANPDYEDEDGGLKGWVGTKASAGICVDHDPDIANLFEAMYSILEAASEKRDYRSIEHFSVAVGRKVDRIELYCDSNQEPLFSLNDADFQHENCFRGTLVFWCEGKVLQINRWIDIMVDPYVVRNSDGNKFDMNEHFADVIGHTLTKIDFNCSVTTKDRTHYTRPIINLHFSNNKCIRVSDNFGVVEEERRVAFFEV